LIPAQLRRARLDQLLSATTIQSNVTPPDVSDVASDPSSNFRVVTVKLVVVFDVMLKYTLFRLDQPRSVALVTAGLIATR
jgi:hypothetical protein